jgi:MoxR-like ATPase
MATQNPIESDGTYPLPEAQVDRFMLKVLVDYPTGTEEFVIVERIISGLETVQAIMGAQQLSALQKAAQAVFVDPSLIEYAVRVSSATRDLPSIGLHDMARYVTYGVSPRASIYMVLAAQALALVRGRQYALPEDVHSVAPDVLRHRLVLSYEALGDDVTAEDVLGAVLAAIPLPEVVLRDRGAFGGQTPPDAADDRAWAPPPR